MIGVDFITRISATCPLHRLHMHFPLSVALLLLNYACSGPGEVWRLQDFWVGSSARITYRAWPPANPGLLGQMRHHPQNYALEETSKLLAFSFRSVHWSRPEAVQDPKRGQREAFAPGTRGACTGTVQPSTRTVPREESTQSYESFAWLYAAAGFSTPDCSG